MSARLCADSGLTLELSSGKLRLPSHPMRKLRYRGVSVLVLREEDSPRVPGTPSSLFKSFKNLG